MDLNNAQIQCHNTIDMLYLKYKEDDFLLQKINNYINLCLPNKLNSASIEYEKRINQTFYLNEEQMIFIQVFLSKYNYYYNNSNNTYYEYDGVDYKIVTKDSIIHNILSAISKEQVLLQWKHKTKKAIFKHINKRKLVTSIPESNTIQSVLNAIYPSILPDKYSAKYFLTIIGDIILKKDSENLFIVDNNIKMHFLKQFEYILSGFISWHNFYTKFITKTHETHLFSNYRVLPIKLNISNQYWREVITKIGLNLICVAMHYSMRYSCAEHFLINSSSDKLILHVNAFKNTDYNLIADKFIDEYIEISDDLSVKLDWNNCYFIWKLFLSNNSLQNIFFSTTLKNILKNKLQYNETDDTFLGISSKFTLFSNIFLKFWKETIVTSNIVDFENDIELDEIHFLFKEWCDNQYNLTEEIIIEIIKHFLKQTVVNDKYILNVTSLLWNKYNEINKYIKYIQTNNIIKTSNVLISFDELYQKYQEYCSSIFCKHLISKRYFEKYMNYKFKIHIMYDKFITVNYLLNCTV